MAKKIPITQQPKVLYQLEFMTNGTPSPLYTYFGSGDKVVFVYCHRRPTIGDVVQLYRSRHPNDKSLFVYGDEINPGKPVNLVIE